MSHENTYYVFGIHPQPNGEVHHTLKGKFFLRNGHMSVLEDHGMSPNMDLEKLQPGDAAARIRRMSSSQRRQILNGEDLRQGLHPDFLASTLKPRSIPADLQEAIGKQFKEPDQEERIGMYDYHREGMSVPQALEIHGKKGYLDGHELASEELAHIMSNVKSGKAAVRHRLAKYESLAKIEPELAAALGQVRSAVQAGHVHPNVFKQLSRSLFTDTLLPMMGNRKAYQDFMARPREGVHIHMDGNSFGSINKAHGHEVGNQAIIAMGKALRAALDESVGRKNGKLFRTGGDEFIAHVPSPDHAAMFSRNLRTKLEAIPAVRGTHQLSMSVGYGNHPEHAEEALKIAKTAKKATGKGPGQEATHVATFTPVTGGV